MKRLMEIYLAGIVATVAVFIALAVIVGAVWIMVDYPNIAMAIMVLLILPLTLGAMIKI